MAPTSRASRSLPKPALWFRLLFESGALGPGKIALMQAIAASGSASAAARSLKMSHARSVRLVAEINAMAPTPLIATRTGGEDGGGAALTPLGLSVLAAHADIAAAAEAAIAGKLATLAGLLK
jgi:molybdate transport system regulatory protein